MKYGKMAVTVAALVAAAGSAVCWADLPTDPNLVMGELPNGMKYIVRQHGNPPGRAAMWIHVSTGSLNEKDNERGISHYLEHLAFNGSENFPPGSVIKFFEGMGLTFGQHQNAFTSFDQTTYQLAFPDNKPETIQKGMTFFADVAGRLSLLQDEVEEERQIILEEKRTRLGAQQRVQEYVLQRLAPESIVGQRLPIGVEETLLSMNRQEFVDYYGKWYVPSNMTIMVVADADPKMVVDQIQSSFNFGDKAPAPIDQDPGVKPSQGLRAIIATDPEYTRGEVSFSIFTAKEPPATTKALQRRDTVRQIATSAFNRRIGKKINKGGTTYLTASASAMNLFSAAMMRGVEAEGKPEDWRTLLKELGEDVQRARLHGFTQQELDDVKKEVIASLEQFVAQESTMPARAMLGRINNAVNQGEPLMSAQQELDLAKDLLPSITVEEVSAEFTRLFSPENGTFIVQLPSTASVPSEQELVDLGKAAFSVQPAKEVEADRASALLEKLPEPGQVSDTALHESSGVTSAWLSNGTRFHHRFMDIRKEQATVTITLAAGNLMETDANRGVADAAGLAWGRPATSKLSSSDIEDLMVGKKANVRGGVGMDAMTLVVSGNPAELEEGMKLAHLMLTDPLIEAPALEQWKKDELRQIESRKTDPRGAMAEGMAEIMYPGVDSRVRPLTAEQVERVTLESAQSWLRNTIASAPIEVGVVGDIKMEQARDLVSRYVGSLAKRERISAGTLDSLRNISKVPGPRSIVREIKTATPLAMAVNGFYGADIENVYDSRCLQMASRVLSTRMIQKVREEEQLAYSPQCAHRAATDFPGFGLFISAMPTQPEKLDRLVTVVDEIYSTFAASGPTEEEMATVRKQIANTLDEQMKEPGFWNARLAVLDYRAAKLDDIMNSAAEQQTYTAQQIKDVFAKYYKPESQLKLTVKPVATAAAEGDKPAAP